MPLEFEDVGGQVAASADGTSRSLEGLVDAAEKADRAHGSLSDTQKSSITISKAFNKNLGKSVGSSIRLAKALGGVVSVSRTLSRDMGAVGSGTAQAARGLEDTFRAATNVKGGMSDAAASTQNFNKQTAGTASAAKSAGKAMDFAASRSSSFGDEVEKSATAMGLLKDQFREGREEAESFGKGIAKNGVGLVAAGAGVVFLAGKVSELVDKFDDAAKSLAQFNVQANVLSRTTIGLDASGFDDIRNELELTREQAGAFFEVLREGANSGVKSVTELEGAAIQLREAFGGDPTEKLKEYIQLLETIPTIDTDLSITASLDDQTASLFALAKEGKISTLIELQSAGLAGGVDITATSPEDVKMLNEQQKAAKTQEDIKDFLINKFYPTWGASAGVVAKSVLGIVAGVGGVLVATGAVSLFVNRGFKRQVAATKDVERAIRQQKVMGAAGRSGRRFSPKNILGGIKRIVQGFKKGGIKGATQVGLRQVGAGGASTALKRGGFKGLVKALPQLTKTTGIFTRVTGVATKTVSGFTKVLKTAGGGLAGPLAIIGIAAGLVGTLLGKLGTSLRKKGSMVSGAFSDMSGEALKAVGTMAGFAAAGAVVASVIPVIGTAAGAVIGGLIGLGKVLITSTDSFGQSVADWGSAVQENSTILTDSGEEIKKYSDGFVAFGGNVQRVGKFIKSFGKAFRENATAFVKAAAKTLYYATVIGPAAVGLFKFGKSVIESATWTEEYAQIMKEGRSAVKAFNKALKEAVEPNEDLEKAQKEAQSVMHESAIAFEREFQGIERVAKSAKVELSNFRKGVADVELSVLREIGGTVAQFDAAIEDSVDATNRSFDILNKGFVQQRKSIIRNAGLNASERRAALDKLKEQELQATQTFVEGLSQVIQGLLKTPAAAQAALEQQIAGQKIDFGAGSGGLGIGEFVNEMGNEIDAGMAGLEDAFSRLSDVEKLSADRRKTLDKAAKDSEKAFKDALKSLPASVKDEIDGLDVNIDNMNIEDVQKVFNNTKEQLKDVETEIEGLTDGLAVLEGGNIRGLSTSAKKITDSIKTTEKELKEAKDASERSEGWIESEADSLVRRKAARERVSELEQKIQQLQVEQVDNSENIRAWLKKQEISEEASAIAQAHLLGETKKATELSGANSAAKEEALKWVKSYRDAEAKEVAELEKRTDILKKSRGLSQVNAALEAVINAKRTIEIQELKDRQVIEEEILSRANGIVNSIRKTNTENLREVKESKRTADLIEARASIDEAAGRGLQNLAEQNEANRDVAAKTLTSVKAQQKDLKERADEAAKVAKAAKDAGDSFKANIFAGIAETLLDESAKLEKDALAAKEKIFNSFSALGDFVEKALAGPKGKRAGFQLDLADAQFEMAEFSKTTEGSIHHTVQVAREAARAQAQIQEKAVKDFLDVARKNAAALREAGEGAAADELMRTAEVEAQARLERIKTDNVKAQLGAVSKAAEIEMSRLDVQREIADIALDVAETFDGSASVIKVATEAQIANEKERLKILKHEAAEARKIGANSIKAQKAAVEVTKQQVSIRKQELALVKKVADARRREIDLAGQGLEAELDFLSEIGGEFSTILDIQGDIVGLEYQKLEVAKQELAEAKAKGATGLELLEAENKVKIQGFNLQRKALGIQKSVFDKILGAAFGELRASVGGRKRNLGAVGLLGTDRTRVVSRAGVPMAAEGGRPGTISERSIQRQLRATGVRGAFTGTSLGGGPRRLGIEGKIEKGLKDGNVSAKTTADATAHLDGEATTPGSIFTHDTTMEKQLDKVTQWLSMIATIAGKIADTIVGQGTVRDSFASGIAKNFGKNMETSTLKGIRKTFKTSDEKTNKDIKKNTEKAAKASENAADCDCFKKLTTTTEKVSKEVKASAQKVEGKVAATSSEQKEAAGEAATKVEKKNETVIDILDKLLATLTTSRIEENRNPLAGGGPSKMGSDFNRIMSGAAEEQTANLRDKEIDKANIQEKAAASKAIAAQDQEAVASRASAAKLRGSRGITGRSELSGKGGTSNFTKLAKLAESTSGISGIGGTAGAAESMNAKAVPPPTSISTGEALTTGIQSRMAPTEGMGATPSLASVSAKEEIGGAGAAGAASTSGITMQIRGTLNVQFDNEYFKAKMGTLVAEVINTPEVFAKIAKAGFLRSK